MSDDERLDLEAWDAEEPPADFAEKVLARVREEAPLREEKKEKRRARRWGVAGGAIATIAIAAAVALRIGSAPAAHGEKIAAERVEVAIGTRALAVLEPGAHVKWDGDDVVQSGGDVFYRVEPGARFRVHTPAGDVEVKGTCFAVKIRGEQKESSDMDKRDVKSGVVGAALSALAFVAVYEGKVAVSHASEHVDLGAGETAQTGAGGVKKTGDLAAGQRALDEVGEPLANANENLVEQVREYRRRLEAIAAQKATLDEKLKLTEERLSAAQADGSAPKVHHEYDLSQDDWKELAKDGTIKFMIPCVKPADWKVSPDLLNALSLAPHDAAIVENAYKRSSQRQWAAIKPLCVEVLGSAEAAEKVGLSSCVHIVLDASREKGDGGSGEAMRQVAEIRAGLRPMPPVEQQGAVMKLFLATTGELKQFETDLAQGLGPEEAHRVVFAPKKLCIGSSTFGGPGPREPDEEKKK